MRSVMKGIGGMRWAAGFAVLALSLVVGGKAEASPQYTMDCTSCHTMPPTDSGTTKKNPATGAVPGNHAGHAGSAASSCVVCHNADVLTYTTSHRNKAIELSDGFGYTRKVGGFLNQTSVPPNPLGTCATAACHSNGTGASRPVATNRATPAWGSAALDKTAGGCVTCHDVAPATGSHPTVGTKHAAYFGTGTGSCVKCHSDHYNETKPFAHATSAGQRNVEVKFATGGAFAANQCSNLYCHSDGRGSYNPPTWGGTLDCSGCHGTAGSDTLSGAHAKHVNNPAFLGTSYGCADCHADTATDNSTIGNVNNHVNSSVNFGSANVGTPNTVTKDCSNAYCHSDGKGTNKTANWSSVTALDCSSCHGSDASPDPQFAANFGAPDYVNAGIDQAKANSHQNHVTGAASCQNCHASTTVDGLSIKAGSLHTNGTADAVAGNGHSFDIASKTCSNVSCHNGGTILSVGAVKWGQSLGCVGCHGDATTLSSFAHAKHVNATTGKAYACDTCHAATVSGSSTIVDKTLHGNSARDVAAFYNGANNTCATSCHGSATPDWKNSATGACGSCHNALTTTANGLIATNAHTEHFSSAYGPQFDGSSATSCAVCHTYTTEIAATHPNSTVNLNAGFNTNSTCLNCHKQTTNWSDVGRLACESCHSTAGGQLSVISGVTAPDKTLAATAGHGKAGIVQACSACHDNTANHISGALGDQKRLLPALTGVPNTECNYCHQDSGKVTARTLNMQVHVGSANTCAACHDPHGTSNSLMLRTTLGSTSGVTFTGSDYVNGAGTGVCQACHTGTAYYKQGVAENNHPSTGCLDCHAHNTASGTAFEPNRECDSCHGYPPAPRQTTYAVTFGVQGNWSSARFENYSGGGGAHLVAAHIKKDAKPSEGWANCTPCHAEGAASHTKAMPFNTHIDNVTVKIDPQYRFSDDAFATYTTAKLVNDPAVQKTGTCFNVSCHFRPSPQWSMEK